MRFIGSPTRPWQGRIGRIEYLMQLPLAVVVGIGLSMMPVHLIRLENPDPDGGAVLAGIVTLVPLMAVLSIPIVRRLHDIGRSGALAISALAVLGLSLVGIRLARLAESDVAIPLLVVTLAMTLTMVLAPLLIPGTPGPNRYGSR